MAGNDVIQNQLRLRVQVEWENAMDYYFARLDRIWEHSTEVSSEDVVGTVRRKIDDDTADAYQKWIEEE